MILIYRLKEKSQAADILEPKIADLPPPTPHEGLQDNAMQRAAAKSLFYKIMTATHLKSKI
jgi:hypothetical protein